MKNEIIEWVIHPGNLPDREITLQLRNRPNVHPLAPETRRRLSAIEVKEGDRALDLGCGCGVYGLYFALVGAADVTLTEIDPSALECARENADLNCETGLHFCTGDMFEPVKGERFDLVVANLPQTPAPECFRLDKWGGPEGDQYLLRLAREAPEHLHEGGRLYFVHIGLASPQAVRGAFLKQFDLKPVHIRKRTFTPKEYDSYLPGLFKYLVELRERGMADFEEEGGRYFFYTRLYRAELRTCSYASR